MEAILILTNGKIYTMDGKCEEAVAVSGDKIIKVGSSKEVIELKGAGTNVIDLQGKAVVPGFIDTHTHLVGYGSSINAVNLENTKSKAEIVAKIKEFILKNNVEPGTWVYGRGWNQNLFEGDKTFPDRHDLDEVSVSHPILILRTCGHVGVVNTIALKNVNITEDTYVEGGNFEKDRDGKVNGVITEASLEWFKKNKSSKQSLGELKKAIVDGSNELLKYGVTSIHSEDSYDLGYGGDFIDIYNTYQDLVKNNELPVRVYQKISMPKQKDIEEFLKGNLRTGDGNEYYRIGPMKQWTDGTMGARTAAMLDDYSDDAGNRGLYYYTQDELYENIKKAHCNGMQVCLHAIGDGALEMVLDAYEKVLLEFPKPNHRHRIVHCFVGNKKQYERIAKLNLIINTQPISTSTDIPMMNDRVGDEREKTCHAWRTLTDLGVCITSSSDIPVETPNVFHGIYAIVTRKNVNGNPKTPWVPNEKVTVAEALKMCTTNGAYASFEEDIKGTITNGKLADLVVLDRDPFNTVEEELKDITVEMTILGGNIKYSLY